MAEIGKILNENRGKTGKIFEKTGKTDLGAPLSNFLDTPLLPTCRVELNCEISDVAAEVIKNMKTVDVI